jgi:hypothetical protein
VEGRWILEESIVKTWSIQSVAIVASALVLAFNLVACGSDSSSGGGGTDTAATDTLATDTGAGTTDAAADATTGTDATTATETTPPLDTTAGTDMTTGEDAATTDAGSTDATAAAGKCMNAADEAVYKANTFDLISGKLKNCTLPCGGSKTTAEGEACIAACMAKDPAPAFSAECSSCFGIYGWCAFKNCLAPCLADAGGTECSTCLVEKGCSPSYESCSGRKLGQ